MEYTESDLAKIRVNRLYSLPSGDVVRVVRLNWQQNKVFVFNYNSRSNQYYDYDIAPRIFSPLFKIGDVAKMFGKKPATLRKYENVGLIGKVNRISLGSGSERTTRVYGLRDIEEIALFFERRRPQGRPSSANVGGINRREINRLIGARFDRK